MSSTRSSTPTSSWTCRGFAGHTYRGVEGFRAFLADWLEPWDDYEFEVEELHDAGDKAVAVVRQRGLSKATGVPVEMHLAHVITYQDGKAIRKRDVRKRGRGPRSRRAAGVVQGSVGAGPAPVELHAVPRG
jgi:ketosteroid isomerase-like protein